MASRPRTGDARTLAVGQRLAQAHGVLAPNAKLRVLVVPQGRAQSGCCGGTTGIWNAVCRYWRRAFIGRSPPCAPDELDTRATGLSAVTARPSFSRDSQSKALISNGVGKPLYSGVAINTASAVAIASRNAAAPDLVVGARGSTKRPRRPGQWHARHRVVTH
jgi:hypothetical protein